ncbi:capsule biosynthesis GfcC family protein [Aliivibrio sifiae]|uniref:Uncharacterized protein n=1 Tax=Aliivibrio sifiae TaxID=566293 RepID=A0A2S7X5D6_9GAMM|nr:capsule biosynthesis GfcC family protein [Aliivibrio sifiae]PQJ85416.1 hypothetical protein BTO23_19040 [Aliivibrio sifiae]GLR76405.1 hypothetical protein GCM10007855_32800 [Aliivibrio sifiae]
MRFLSSLFILLTLSVSAYSMANTSEDISEAKKTLTVTLIKQGLELNYSQPVRLSQVAIDANTHAKFYDLGAVLSDENQQKNNKDLRNEVIDSLFSLSRETSLFSSKNKHEKSATQLSLQLKKESFVNRIFTSFDVDLLRINDKANPLLSGYYQLFLGPRPTSVSFFGAINSDKSIQLPLIEHAIIDDYLENLPLSSVADTSIIYVIQPNGEVQHTEFSVWQNNPVYLAPGAIVFIPFADLPAGYSSLNDSIVQLLRNKAF